MEGKIIANFTLRGKLNKEHLKSPRKRVQRIEKERERERRNRQDREKRKRKGVARINEK